MSNRQKLRKGILLTSFFFFPATFFYLSPVLIIHATFNGIINGSFVMFFLMFCVALLLGRSFCGWVCPGAGCQEALFSVRDKKVVKGDFSKWLIWIPWIMAIIFIAVRHGGYEEIDFFYKTRYGLSITDTGSLIAYLSVLFVLIVLPALVVGRRSFCHHLCWMAPFMILARKIRNSLKLPALQLQAEPHDCCHCHTCTENCPMSLPVELMVQNQSMEHAECILCGTCVDGCKSGVICFSFSKVIN